MKLRVQKNRNQIADFPPRADFGTTTLWQGIDYSTMA